MASEQWYYARSGQKFGPVDGLGLKQLAASGDIAVSDLVWRDGMAGWVPAGKVQGLFPEGVAAACPPPLPVSPSNTLAAPSVNLDERYGSIYRSSDDKIVLGVAGGLAHKFGLPVGIVRALICVSMFFWIGLVYFAGFFLPRLPTKGVPRPV
jgi:phage shock protein PspC (stress-responsive transcriptional regulator)